MQKQFLVDRGLGKSFSGGLSSYALVIMCACFLNVTNRVKDELTSKTKDIAEKIDAKKENEEIGELLLSFLTFFGEKFDPRETGISISKGFFRRHHQNQHGSSVTMQGSTQQQRRRSFRIEDLLPLNHVGIGGLTHSEMVPPHKFDPLLIEDPLQPGNNVGRNVFRIHQIQRACADTARSIRALNHSWPLGAIISSWRPVSSSEDGRKNVARSNSIV